jgi:Zn-dependent protease
MEMTLVQKIAISAIPIIFAITLHEVAHGWVASKFGDQTARLSGRLSVNPIHHIDPVGTIIVPLLMLTTTGFIFGWAKPVPVDARNLRNPRRDMVFVALAGPISNIIMAVFWGAICWLGLQLADRGTISMAIPLFEMGKVGITINVVLAVLNFIPLPPLDGSRVLMSVLPPRLGYKVSLIEPYGFYILLALIMTGVLSAVMSPAIFFVMNAISALFNL